MNRRIRQSNAINTIFRDVLYCYIGVLIVYLVVAMSSITPTVEDSSKTINGDLVVSIFWPEGNDDVDLWLLAPHDLPVGFSNKSGSVWNLLRDDTGNNGDLLKLNYENAFSRGKPDGNWVVNIHCYRCVEPVTVIARLETRAYGGTIVKVDEKEIVLNPTEQVTVWNFEVENQKIMDVTSIPVDILVRKKGQ